MPKLSLDVAELQVTSFDTAAQSLIEPPRVADRPTRIDCTYPRYSCLLVCPLV